ncbi:hypothetical protein M426DRAFT_199995 [Hypoxylon sp. CI-4A]|nr:hypothetical protein M426DRAFT_199995 [Hypoxylon sp. CI-4A]
MSEPAPRIAIKFATTSSSKLASGSKKPTHTRPPSTLGKRHRPHALNHDSDSGSDEEEGGKHEVVTTFGGDWSESETKRRDTKSSKSKHSDTPYVITGHKNRDWKAEVKAQRVGRDGTAYQEKPQSSESVERDPPDHDKQIKWGLTVTKKADTGETQTQHEVSSGETKPITANNKTDPREEDVEVPVGGDNDAMDALLGKKRKSAKDLVIEGTTRNSTPTTASEQDAYRRRMEEAADVSTIDEYDQIPEGEFGAAMLRGMGWNGEERGAKPKEVKRRPNLMGLGSKEDEEIRKGELARKHGHRERRPRLDEYRRDKEKERRARENHRGDSYKSEREHERERERRDPGYNSSHRDRDRNSHRHSDRSYRR